MESSRASRSDVAVEAHLRSVTKHLFEVGYQGCALVGHQVIEILLPPVHGQALSISTVINAISWAEHARDLKPVQLSP
jgi:hypothetical protein